MWLKGTQQHSQACAVFCAVRVRATPSPQQKVPLSVCRASAQSSPPDTDFRVLLWGWSGRQSAWQPPLKSQVPQRRAGVHQESHPSGLRTQPGHSQAALPRRRRFSSVQGAFCKPSSQAPAFPRPAASGLLGDTVPHRPAFYFVNSLQQYTEL